VGGTDGEGAASTARGGWAGPEGGGGEDEEGRGVTRLKTESPEKLKTTEGRGVTRFTRLGGGGSYVMGEVFSLDPVTPRQGEPMTLTVFSFLVT
jgi:hypothetical protein